MTSENLGIINRHFGPRVLTHKYQEPFGEGYIWPAYSPDLSPSRSLSEITRVLGKQTCQAEMTHPVLSSDVYIVASHVMTRVS